MLSRVPTTLWMFQYEYDSYCFSSINKTINNRRILRQNKLQGLFNVSPLDASQIDSIFWKPI